MTISKKYKNSNIKILQSAFDDISVEDSLTAQASNAKRGHEPSLVSAGTPSLLDRGGLSKIPTQSGGNYVNNNIHTDTNAKRVKQSSRNKSLTVKPVKKKIPLIDTTKLLTQ